LELAAKPVRLIGRIFAGALLPYVHMRRHPGQGAFCSEVHASELIFRAGILVILSLFVTASQAVAESPPVEFGLQAIRDAAEERGLKKIRIRAEISTAEAETYRVTSYRVTGGDLRGLMYGLLEAAEHIRAYGRILPARGKPSTPIRGIRRFVHNQDLEEDWYLSREYWRDYIRMLARNRFNRLNLVFAHQTNYMVPPYPYWVNLEDYPNVLVPGLPESDRKRNLETLCFIAKAAADHAVNFTLGIWQHNAQPNQAPTVQGLTPQNIGPYSQAALKRVLQSCPAIRSVQFRTNAESGILRDKQVEFFRDHVFRALRETGRLVTLDLRGWRMDEGMLEAATGAGIPMRLSSKYWAEHLGRPYQPAKTIPNYSYMDFLRRPNPGASNTSRPYRFFWELWSLGSHRLLLWGDPGYVKRAIPTLTMSDSAGFEIDAPLAQKGFGNRPGKWGIFAADQKNRKSWNWDFERYWFFYQSWGRLTYDPKTKDRLWLNELKRRFGDAAPDVLQAYQTASRVLSEIVSANMPDPNMYMWPEINPGGLMELYRNTLPSDPRMIASFEESVRLRSEEEPSAKQQPAETASLLQALAQEIDNSIVKVSSVIGADHSEWRGTEPDFRVLAHLARFHGHRQTAALRLTEFYETGERESLQVARHDLEAALKVWEELAEFTSGLYPLDMVYGPEDHGHWKDKLPYIRHDLNSLDEREWLLDRFGHIDFGFDFGPALNSRLYRYAVEPRFTGATAGMSYDERLGYGWVTDAERRETSGIVINRGKLRATARNPKNLPENLLFGDWVEGAGAQVFRVRTGDGEFLVSYLLPDGNATTMPMNATNGVLDITFPVEEWKVCGLIVKSSEPESGAAIPPAAKRPPRPTITHTLPRRITAGTDLILNLRVSPATSFDKVRLHYRPANQLAHFQSLDTEGPYPKFIIPGDELSAEWDMMYYFEVLREDGSGWFHPDPVVRTPYYVLKVRP